MQVQIEASWKDRLNPEFEKPYFQNLASFIKEEYKNHRIYPPAKQIFNAFEQCPFEATQVVILGQDPYHGEGQAHGLCFSVADGIKPPPSLVNIFKELKADLGKEMPKSGNLEAWVSQGVLLLNAILTVRANTPTSHQKKGWEEFTDAVIRTINEQKENVVFLLWGAYAQKKAHFVDPSKHLVLKSGHPSPLSAQHFFGNKHFSQTNQYLISKGKEPIIW